MARYTRRNAAEARSFARAIIRDQRANVGRGARDPGSWSDAYAVRIANRWHEDITAGRPLDLQAARRGPAFTERVRAEQAQAAERGRRLRGGLEHPRARWVGPLNERGRPDLSESVGHYSRQYRRPSSGRRFMNRLAAERVQVIGYGMLAEGYGGSIPYPVWRVIYTGPNDDGAWGMIAARSAEMFDTIERLEIRWGPGIGD